eukprot:CAMPEP_0194211628 /NCGR_PEP_ID=MMETSP0156-20130528/10729_1 /TAXON_ID=33649 /ORGANISM="Thalassionema nitzschioides, Strain L26-B" /LENGTH=68 /DNA_ID=CAMNT_0038939239 /DNA_START=49 /DNA_END=255 /DNA_ORIENTATION=-
MVNPDHGVRITGEEEVGHKNFMTNLAQKILPQHRRKSNERVNKSYLEKQWSDNKKLNIQFGASFRHSG